METRDDLQPRAKTSITGHGSVVFHDVTSHGLHRLCVAQYDRYPDIETWLGLLKSDARPMACRYVERITAGVFIGYLWIYFKEGE
jgi:hypothetical protein